MVDYVLRNRALGHWCLTIFVVSLFLIIIPHFGFTPPMQDARILSDLIPNWLAWPINLTLLVATLVWLMTNTIATRVGSFYNEWLNHVLWLAFARIIWLCFGRVFEINFLLITSSVIILGV